MFTDRAKVGNQKIICNREESSDFHVLSRTRSEIAGSVGIFCMGRRPAFGRAGLERVPPARRRLEAAGQLDPGRKGPRARGRKDEVRVPLAYTIARRNISTIPFLPLFLKGRSEKTEIARPEKEGKLNRRR